MEVVMLFSDLEMLVMHDMYMLGYDSSNPEDVNTYWEMMLDGH